MQANVASSLLKSCAEYSNEKQRFQEDRKLGFWFKFRLTLTPCPPPPPHVPSSQILIRLRQAVDHPYLVIYSATKREGMTPAMNSAAGQNPTPAPAPPAETAPRGSQSRTSRSSTAQANGAATPNGGRSSRSSSSRTATAGTQADNLGDTSSDSESSDAEGGGKAAGAQSGAGAGGRAGAQEYGSDDEEDSDLCGICREPAERLVSSSCGHSFCRTW